MLGPDPSIHAATPGPILKSVKTDKKALSRSRERVG